MQGTVATGYEGVREEFARVVAGEREDYAGQLVAYVRGELVVDLWTGPEFTADTLTGGFSSTKGAAHLGVALRGQGERVFVSGGDVWSVAAEGGVARLLVSHAATESRPLYSPDGRSLAFTSTRTGAGDVYVLALATGELKRVSASDANTSSVPSPRAVSCTRGASPPSASMPTD